LIARYLESQGIPTLCMTSALDIVELGRPPRAVFVDYQLGHTTGRLYDKEDQLALLTAALEHFDLLTEPGSIVSLPHTWPDDDWQTIESRADQGDTRSARDTSPQWKLDDDRIKAESETRQALSKTLKTET